MLLIPLKKVLLKTDKNWDKIYPIKKWISTLRNRDKSNMFQKRCLPKSKTPLFDHQKNRHYENKHDTRYCILQ